MGEEGGGHNSQQNAFTPLPNSHRLSGKQPKVLPSPTSKKMARAIQLTCCCWLLFGVGQSVSSAQINKFASQPAIGSAERWPFVGESIGCLLVFWAVALFRINNSDKSSGSKTQKAKIVKSNNKILIDISSF
jgi:hypothetical protein